MRWRKSPRHRLQHLAQVLDDGRLTDSQGRTVDFTNTVIIMTSNLGAEHLLAGMVGKSLMKIARERVMEKVRRHFRPELLNRVDDPLSQEQLRKVARLQMKDVAARLAERGITLAVLDAALDVVLSESYDPVYGAKPIRMAREEDGDSVVQLQVLYKHQVLYAP